MLRQPSAVWSRLSIQLPVRNAVCSWVKQRAPAVASIDMFGLHPLRDKPAWSQEAEGISSMSQMESLLDILASSGARLTSLRLAADNIQPVNAASQVSLESVWPDILSFTGLQSLALLENENSNYIACDLADLTVLTGLTSLWLQQGRSSPHGGDPTTGIPLPIDFGDFEYLLDELNLQCLTLANIRFNTDLDTFWEGASLHKLKHLRLDYITFDGFDHFKEWSAPVAMPLALSRLVDLRSLTLRCCGFQSLSEEMLNLRNLEHLDIMDPYQDLRVLQQMLSLTWLRVFVYGHYDPFECLAFTFPPSLHFLELRCNQKRYAKGGSVYLRRPDQVLLKACFHAEMPLRTVNIKSHNCFAWVGLPDGFLQLRHLQEVILQEAGLKWLPEGPWLQQLKLLDLSYNSFSRIPPVLTSCKGTLQKLVLNGALRKRPKIVVRNDDASSAEGSGSEGSQHGSRSQSARLPQEGEQESVPAEDIAMIPEEFEIFASARGDEAFSAATCRAVYQELLDAGIDVQITEAALSDSW